MKKITFDNWRVEVFPHMGYMPSTDPYLWRNACDALARDIKRHCDNVQSVVVSVDKGGVCEHCGWVWTEDSSEYNGGCCAKDEAANPTPLYGGAS